MVLVVLVVSALEVGVVGHLGVPGGTAALSLVASVFAIVTVPSPSTTTTASVHRNSGIAVDVGVAMMNVFGYFTVAMGQIAMRLQG